MIVRQLVRPSFTEWHATVFGPSLGSVAESAAAAWRELAQAMREAEVVPLHERTWCAGGAREELEAARSRALRSAGLDPETPWAHVRGREGDDEDPRAVSIQLWGCTRRASAATISTVDAGGRSGRLLSAPGIRMLWLAGVDGRDADGSLPSGIGDQARAMLRGSEQALESAGFTFQDVARTWIYARELLPDYRELNAARSAFFAERGIGGEAHPLPASTGIQGRVDLEACVMDLLAIQGEAGVASFSPLHDSDRQGPAAAYGSSFSRGMSVDFEGRQTVLVSGTSSIAPDGATLHPHDPELQSVETLLGLAALLEPLGATLHDIVAGTLFTRDAGALAAFDRVAARLCLPPLPLVRVRADVCRPDLTVEVEAVVIVPAPSPKGRTDP